MARAVLHNFNVLCILLTKVAYFKKTKVAQSFSIPISSKTLLAQSVLHKFYLKQQMEVPWILLTTHTNLGKFTVAFPFFGHALGQTVRIFCQVVAFITFLTNNSNF